MVESAEDRRARAAANPTVWRVGESEGTRGLTIYQGTELMFVAFDPGVAAWLVGVLNAEVRRVWRPVVVKSSFSNASCVDVVRENGLFLITNTGESDGPVLVFTEPEWVAFVLGVKAGEFDA